MCNHCELPESRYMIFLYTAWHIVGVYKYWLNKCHIIWSPSFDPELQLKNEGTTILSCHFLCDIKLVSANSHLLNFSYFSLMIHSLRTFTIFLSWKYDIVFSYGNPGFPLRLYLIIRLQYRPPRRSSQGETFFKRETDMSV